MWTGLADALRRAGCKVEERPGWRTRGHGGVGTAKTIVCHHTAGPARGNMPSLGVVTAGRAGLSGPLCNLALGRDGTWYVVAAGLAYHAGKVRQREYGNYYAIGIEAEATGTSTWPKVQMDAYAKGCKALCDYYGIPVSRVLGHKEVCSPPGRKIDPNFDMAAFRERVRAAGTTKKEWDEMATKKEVTEALVDALTADGVVEVPKSARYYDAKNPTISVQAALRRAMADADFAVRLAKGEDVKA